MTHPTRTPWTYIVFSDESVTITDDAPESWDDWLATTDPATGEYPALTYRGEVVGWREAPHPTSPARSYLSEAATLYGVVVDGLAYADRDHFLVYRCAVAHPYVPEAPEGMTYGEAVTLAHEVWQEVARYTTLPPSVVMRAGRLASFLSDYDPSL